MNGNLSWSQFGPYVPQHGATDLEAHAAMDVAGGGHAPIGQREIPTKGMDAYGAMHNAMVLGQTSPN